MKEYSLSVAGMSCGGCEASVEDSVGAIDGVGVVEADSERDTVDVEAEGVATDEIAAAIEDAGYDVRS